MLDYGFDTGSYQNLLITLGVDVINFPSASRIGWMGFTGFYLVLSEIDWNANSSIDPTVTTSIFIV